MLPEIKKEPFEKLVWKHMDEEERYHLAALSLMGAWMPDPKGGTIVMMGTEGFIRS